MKKAAELLKAVPAYLMLAVLAILAVQVCVILIPIRIVWVIADKLLKKAQQNK